MANEQKLFMIRVSCWLDEIHRIKKWLESSTASRDTIHKVLSSLLKHKRDLEKDPHYEMLSDTVKADLQHQWKKLTKYSVRSKRRVRQSMEEPLAVVQVPSKSDLRAMREFPAAMEDNQKTRLKKIRGAVHRDFDTEHIIETDAVNSENWVDHLPWEVVFDVIRHNEVELVDMAFASIPDSDPMKTALLQAHDAAYILTILKKCASLASDQYVELNSGDPDVLIGQRSFEIFFHDLIATLEHRQKLNFSFGLPTHHTYRDKAAGFCLLNKIAVVIAFEQAHARRPVHHVIIGTDVNRDDGLCSIIMNGPNDYHCTHFDIYDSRVYPWHDLSDVEADMGWPPTLSESAKTATWIKSQRRYQSIDLSMIRRAKPEDIHPAIKWVLSELETILVKAVVEKQERVIIYLPTGWDSHAQEIAGCGTRKKTGHVIGKAEKRTCRFNDRDWEYFNNGLFELSKNYQDGISRIYWQLEGGYTDEVNFKQVTSLARGFQLQPKESLTASSSSEAGTSDGRVLRPRR